MFFEIEIPGGMHVIAAEGSDHDEIAAIFKIEHRRRSQSSGFTAPGRQQYERCGSDAIDKPAAR
jgi:hypothetical protein